MPPININYIAVFLAAVVNMVLGFIWYGPLFGRHWMGLSGVSDLEIESARRKGMAKKYLLALTASLATSYVLAHALVFTSAFVGTSGVAAGFTVGIWSWLGFVAPVTLGAVLWENKPWGLWLLNNSYYLISLLLIAVLLSVWK